MHLCLGKLCNVEVLHARTQCIASPHFSIFTSQYLNILTYYYNIGYQFYNASPQSSYTDNEKHVPSQYLR